MERFAQRENILLGYSPQRSFENSRKTSDTNSELDFSDVFGGPPRQFSIQETRTRYSFSETTLESEEDSVLLRSTWSGLDEKPVFGTESVSRRPYPSEDFFDDIFKGDETKSYSSPRRNSRDFFASTAASRMLSPSRPLPPKAEPFSPSFPAQFSLPAKLTKAMDFPAFGSINHSPLKNKDGISNEISYEHASDSSLSRFSSEATEVQNETRNDPLFHHPSPLSNEVSHSSEESSYETKSDDKDMGAKLKNHSESKGPPLNSGQFHFSIYKWAGSGVQMLMPLGERGKSRFREMTKTARCSSSNGRIESDSIGRNLPTVEEHIISLATESPSLKIKNGKHDETGKEKKIESCSDVDEAHPKVPKPKNDESEGHAIPEGEAISMKKTEEESHLKNETNLYEKNEKETYMNEGQAPKTYPKPLYAMLNGENEGQGKVQDKVKVTNIANKLTNVSTSAKKTDTKRINSNRSEVNNTSLQSSEANSRDAFGRSRVKGKVKEFAKIFDQETSPKPKTDFDRHSSRWKGMDFNVTENRRTNAVKTDEKVHPLNKNKILEFSSRQEDDNNKNKVKQEPHLRSSVHKTSGLSNNEKNASVFSDSLPNSYDNKVDNRDESFQGYFLVEELSHVEDNVLQTGGESEEIQASNAKIQQWSNGRKGNIRSLLSTLQFVLWPESGWKPVPLIDLIEGSAVKRAYQRALLCLHPDKLQQKGAAYHQKYIAEKVFDILQEAWDHFNSLGAI